MTLDDLFTVLDCIVLDSPIFLPTNLPTNFPNTRDNVLYNTEINCKNL